MPRKTPKDTSSFFMLVLQQTQILFLKRSPTAEHSGKLYTRHLFRYVELLLSSYVCANRDPFCSVSSLIQFTTQCLFSSRSSRPPTICEASQKQSNYNKYLTGLGYCSKKPQKNFRQSINEIHHCIYINEMIL